jgi:hypothetical protein
MPILDIDPGQSPEAPGTLMFYEQGADPSTGFQVTSRGAIVSAIAQAFTAASGSDVVFSAKITGNTANQIEIRGDGRIQWGGGVTAPDVNLFRDGATRLHTVNTFVSEGDIQLDVAGGGVNIREGTNARMGLATLAAGTVVVATTKVTANSRIFLTAQTSGAAPGALRVSARTAGTSFTITSTSGTDTSTVAWLIMEPAA